MSQTGTGRSPSTASSGACCDPNLHNDFAGICVAKKQSNVHKDLKILNSDVFYAATTQTLQFVLDLDNEEIALAGQGEKLKTPSGNNSEGREGAQGPAGVTGGATGLSGIQGETS